VLKDSKNQVSDQSKPQIAFHEAGIGWSPHTSGHICPCLIVQFWSEIGCSVLQFASPELCFTNWDIGGPSLDCNQFPEMSLQKQ
jgi:hypothetical protein